MRFSFYVSTTALLVPVCSVLRRNDVDEHFDKVVDFSPTLMDDAQPPEITNAAMRTDDLVVSKTNRDTKRMTVDTKQTSDAVQDDRLFFVDENSSKPPTRHEALVRFNSSLSQERWWFFWTTKTTTKWPSNYNTLSSRNKMDVLWRELTADNYPYGYMGASRLFWSMGDRGGRLQPMQDVTTDWREAGHEKLTHGVGAVAKAAFVWNNDAKKYTGMFQQADHCIIRMANAACPKSWQFAYPSFNPNFAVKCLNDGSISANMQFIWQLEGYDYQPANKASSCSYFEAPLMNHCPDTPEQFTYGLKRIVASFKKADANPMYLGLSEFAKVKQDGSEASLPTFPFALLLLPNASLNSIGCESFTCWKSYEVLNSQLLKIPANSILYYVYAVHDPLEMPVLIGSLNLLSAFESSGLGDTQLFFRHTFWTKELSAMTNQTRKQLWEQYAASGEGKVDGAAVYYRMKFNKTV